MSEKFSAAYWLVLASDAQELADSVSDPEAKRTMTLIAAGYLKLAEHHASLLRASADDKVC